MPETSVTGKHRGSYECDITTLNTAVTGTLVLSFKFTDVLFMFRHFGIPFSEFCDVDI